MRKLLLFLIPILMSGFAFAEESVTVPWGEFKQLYRESIEKEVRKQTEAAEPGKAPLVYTLNEAGYSLSVGENSAQGEARISGKIVSGSPKPIPLFGTEMIVSAVGAAVGGDLMCGETPAAGIQFLPGEKAGEFQLALSFLAQVREDNGSRLISFEIPAALRNTLRLELPSGARLLEAPGIAGADGKRHFSSSSALRIRFLGKETLDAELIEIDTFSRIAIQGNRMILTTTCAPIQPLSEPFVLKAPEGARYIASSLSASSIKKLENGAFQVQAPPGEKGTFWLRFAMEEAAANAELAVTLPRINKNNGNEGDFFLEDPPDGQIRPAGEGIVSQISVARLGKEIRPAAGTDSFYMHAAPDKPVRLAFARFQSLGAPPIVLDALYFFTSFEENGNILSTLVMDIPPAAGPRLKMPLIPDSTIWSLSVNGEPKKAYVAGDNAWIIPLANGETSHVELALLRKGEPLGLRGRLETIVPETDLPSQRVCVGIALPQRVQLMSIEGPVSPAPGESWKTPREFVGNPHFFSRSFHKGEEMRLALSYKEPVKRESVAK